MPTALRFIRKRIKSIKSTRQVTKAMEAVSASKMRKAVAAALASRNYSGLGWELVENLAVAGVKEHPLLKENESKKILAILITSDRGLCGGLNTQVIKKFLASISGQEIDIVTIGKKGQNSMRRFKQNIVATFLGLSDKPLILGIRPISKMVVEEYTKGTYSRVLIAFSDFKSVMKQIPTMRQLLPIKKETLEEVVGPENQPAASNQQPATEYIFEPDTKTLLDAMLPRLIEIQIYQALLESAASEHSARMMTMRNATDNASSMIDELTLTYNQARQATITQEIAEISAGRAALGK